MDEGTQNVTEAKEAAKRVAAQLEPALKGLAKLLGAIKFYPPGHPTLKDVTTDAKNGFAPLFKDHESVVVGVRRTGFYYEEEPVATANTMLQKMAAGLFTRRVQRLMILKDLSCRDLWETAHILLRDVDALQKEGGVQELLQREKVTTVWANIVDVKGIFDRKEEIEAEKAQMYGTGSAADEAFLASLGAAEGGDSAASDAEPATPAAAAHQAEEELSLEALLKAIAGAATEQDFSELLPGLVPAIRANLNRQSAHLVLQAFALLVPYAEGGNASPVKQQAARQVMGQLTTNDVLTYYVNLLCAQVRFDERRMTWEKITRFFGAPLSSLLMARLIEEEDQSTRKILFESLATQGKVALPAILPSLQDSRWYVVRNAAYMIGEIRDPSTVEPLKPLLQHADLRVRREAIRALTRVGGSSVISILLRTLQGDDEELRRQAMLCLGAMKNPATVPMLMQFIQIPDWRLQKLAAKVDALQALGEIGSSEALPMLTAIAGKSRFFFRSRNDELRAAALAAIGDIGGNEAIQLLERMTKTSSPTVAKAAFLALKQARKGQKHE